MAGASDDDGERGRPGLVVGGARAGHSDESFKSARSVGGGCEDSDGQGRPDQKMV